MADIFCKYGKAYIEAHPMPLEHYKIMNSIVVCRTAALGGDIEVCDSCGKEQNSYNSCRNRHCPKCQALTKARWIEARQAELLPISYFHNVFTLPHELNLITLAIKKPCWISSLGVYQQLCKNLPRIQPGTKMEVKLVVLQSSTLGIKNFVTIFIFTV